jgi:hypothetical protein
MPRIKGWNKTGNLSWKSDEGSVIKIEEKFTGKGYGYEFTIKCENNVIGKTQDKDVARSFAVGYMRSNPDKVEKTL